MDSLGGGACPLLRLEAGQDPRAPCWAALGKLCPAGDICPSTHPPRCLPACPTPALQGKPGAGCVGTCQQAGQGWGKPGTYKPKQEMKEMGETWGSDLRRGYIGSAHVCSHGGTKGMCLCLTL